MDNSVCVAELLYDLVATDAYEMLVLCCIRLRASGNERLSVCFKATISCSVLHLGQDFEKER